jgi:hypothetical protein
MAIEQQTKNKNRQNKNLSYVNRKIPGMKGKLKRFDLALSNRYDLRARDVIKACLGDGIIDNPSIYGEDMLVLTNRIPYGYIELQVYGTWKDRFPYPAPYVFERKMRFNDNTLFICFNAKFDQALLFSKQCISDKKVVSERYSEEYIHYVPWRNVIKVDISKLTYDLILSYADPETYYELLEAKESLRDTGASEEDIEEMIDEYVGFQDLTHL